MPACIVLERLAKDGADRMTWLGVMGKRRPKNDVETFQLFSLETCLNL
jgi:hypothetical protein